MFFQQRIGKSGKEFKLFKFATMLKNSPNIATGTVTVKNDPRVLPVGRFLRCTKVNELPQLINIFIGDMSIIGPRPLTTQTFSSYPLDIQKLIVKVRPGLSGIGSIIFRNEEDILDGNKATLNFYDNVIAPYKGALEEWFVNNNGIITYFWSILITIWVVLIPKTQIPWRVFKKLPVPPKELHESLNYATNKQS